MSDKKFNLMRFDVLMDDGTEHIGVIIRHSDRVAGEITAQRNKWGDGRPLIQVSFWVWHALRRESRISMDVKFETWVDQVVEMERDDEEEQPDPTLADLSSDSQSNYP